MKNIPKQETLEDAAEKWVFETNGHKWSNNDDTAGDNYGSFIAGANYQAERISLMEIELNHTKTLLASCEKALEDRDKKAERMYSEQEVYDLLEKVIINAPIEGLTHCDEGVYRNLKDWFEQVKKK